MSDEADLAQSHMELEEEMRRRYKKPVGLEVEATGKCLNCGERLDSVKRWCDDACREDWEVRRGR